VCVCFPFCECVRYPVQREAGNRILAPRLLATAHTDGDKRHTQVGVWC